VSERFKHNRYLDAPKKEKEMNKIAHVLLQIFLSIKYMHIIFISNEMYC